MSIFVFNTLRGKNSFSRANIFQLHKSSSILNRAIIGKLGKIWALLFITKAGDRISLYYSIRAFSSFATIAVFAVSFVLIVWALLEPEFLESVEGGATSELKFHRSTASYFLIPNTRESAEGNRAGEMSRFRSTTWGFFRAVPPNQPLYTPVVLCRYEEEEPTGRTARARHLGLPRRRGICATPRDVEAANMGHHWTPSAQLDTSTHRARFTLVTSVRGCGGGLAENTRLHHVRFQWAFRRKGTCAVASLVARGECTETMYTIASLTSRLVPHVRKHI